MTGHDLPPEAEALDAFLDGDQRAALSPDQAALVDSLMAAASAARPDPTFSRALEKRLAVKAARRRDTSGAASILHPFLWSDPMRKFFAFSLTTVIVAALLIGGVWIIARLNPNRVPGLSKTETVP